MLTLMYTLHVNHLTRCVPCTGVQAVLHLITSPVQALGSPAVLQSYLGLPQLLTVKEITQRTFLTTKKRKVGKEEKAQKRRPHFTQVKKLVTEQAHAASRGHDARQPERLSTAEARSRHVAWTLTSEGGCKSALRKYVTAAI